MTTPIPARQQLPSGPDAQLPVAWQAAKQTYALVGLNYKSVAKLGALPVVVIGGLQTLYSLYPTLINLALSLCGNLVATAVFAVGLNQLVMASQQNQLYRFRLGKRGFKYVTLTLMALIPVMLMTMGIFALGFVLARLINAPSFGYLPMLVATLLGLAVASYTAVRFSILLPAMYHDVAIDLHRILRSTRGQAKTIWLGLLLTLSPILVVTCLLLVVQIGYGPFPWVAGLLQGFTLISAVPLSVMFLAFNCHRYSQITLPPRIKTVRAAQRSATTLRLSFYTVALFLAHLNNVLGKLTTLPKKQPAPRPAARKAGPQPRARPAAARPAPTRPTAGARPQPAAAPRPAQNTKRPGPTATAKAAPTAHRPQPTTSRPANNNRISTARPVASAPSSPAPPPKAPPANGFQQKLQKSAARK